MMDQIPFITDTRDGRHKPGAVGSSVENGLKQEEDCDSAKTTAINNQIIVLSRKNTRGKETCYEQQQNRDNNVDNMFLNFMILDLVL